MFLFFLKALTYLCCEIASAILWLKGSVPLKDVSVSLITPLEQEWLKEAHWKIPG